MGNYLSSFYAKIKNLSNSQPTRILMLGLDAAGKTTILYKLKLQDMITTIPTIGFNVEEVRYKKLTFVIWDIGGQDKIRKLWKYYFQETSALIFVVDASDRDRIDEAKEQLLYLLNQDELDKIPVLIYANKQDINHSMNASELAEAFGMHIIKSRKWYISPSCASNGYGIYEGLDWLANQLSRNNVSN